VQRVDSKSGSSGWGWGAGNPSARPPLPRRPEPPPRSNIGAVIAGLLFVGLLFVGGVGIVIAMPDEGEAPVVNVNEAVASNLEPADADPEPKTPPTDATKSDAAPAELDVPLANPRKETVWTIEAPTTLEELGEAWSISRDTLVALNPKLAEGPITAGTQVVVHAPATQGSISVGSPNDGKLIRGVPLPEGKAWFLPVDRARAFATIETITALTAALDAYGKRFPEAAPVQIGDLSARQGGKIYGHESHQSGRDVDIRLVPLESGEDFDWERTWFLVKTLVDGSEVTAIFLNARQQTYLRVAAEADVGAAEAAPYFALIKHERGHTIHMHVRYACPKASHRCVAYPLPDRGEQAPKTASKLPSKLPGKTTPGVSKLPVLRPKGGGSTLPDKTPKKGKKGKKGKKTLSPR
jgi:murein endopeptidase